MRFSSLLSSFRLLPISFPRFQTLKTQCHYFIKPKSPVNSCRIVYLGRNSPLTVSLPRFLSDRLRLPVICCPWLSLYEFHTMHAEHCRYKMFRVKSDGSFLMLPLQIRQRLTKKAINCFRATGFILDSKGRGTYVCSLHPFVDRIIYSTEGEAGLISDNF